MTTAAAKKRMMMIGKSPVVAKPDNNVPVSMAEKSSSSIASASDKTLTVVRAEKNAVIGNVNAISQGEVGKGLNFGKELFTMVFWNCVSRVILSQWSNQGTRFSSDPETSMGLVRHEGGPCGVLATIQAFLLLKCLLVFPYELGKNTTNLPSQNFGPNRLSHSESVTLGNFAFQSLNSPNIEDIFNSSLNLEETHFNEGFREGYNDGLVFGKQEGKEVGLKVGFEIGEELGFYQGCINVWNSAIRVEPSCFSSRVQKNIKQMEELIQKYPILDPEDESVQEIMDSLRLKFKIISATLSMKLEYKGYPKSSEAVGIDF